MRLTTLRVRARHRRQYRELSALWTGLHHAFPEDRYYRRVIECRDGLLRISPRLARNDHADKGQPLARQLLAALFLEELTHTLAGQWLRYRHHRWPASANPHLLVSRRTAPNPDRSPVSAGTPQLAVHAGATLRQLPQDRILDEAAATANSLRLIRLFGISEGAAMRYVTAAHPERTAELPVRALRGPRRASHS